MIQQVGTGPPKKFLHCARVGRISKLMPNFDQKFCFCNLKSDVVFIRVALISELVRKLVVFKFFALLG